MQPQPAAGHCVYVHVPFCRQRCPYCDFYRVTDPAHASERANAWLELVLREMDMLSATGDLDRGAPIRTFYLGGGTPSLISPNVLAAFIQGVRSRFAFLPDAEITIEMQPDTADRRKLQEYAAAGINRFSIGAQTFDPALLQRTERRHTVDESREMISCVRDIASFSIDLICAWPGQDLAAWQCELEEAISWQPEHISVYELTFHEGTRFTRAVRAGEIAPPDEAIREAMFNFTADLCIGAGYEHYEVSNFAKTGCRSRHNENYWQLGNYAGLGAGAHSFFHPHRYVNANDVDAYETAIRAGHLFRRLDDPADVEMFAMENLQMALRLREGVDLEQFERRFGFPLREARSAEISSLVSEGLANQNKQTLTLTRTGWIRMDSILEYLV